MKCCSKCGEIKVDSQFYRDNNCDDKMKSVCADCDKERFSKYYRENAFLYKDRSKEAYLQDKERFKEAAKKWKSENPERFKELTDKYKQSPTFLGQKKIANLKIKFKELKCSIKHFVLYIESQMDLDTRWDNYKIVWDIPIPENVTHYTDYKIRKF